MNVYWCICAYVKIFIEEMCQQQLRTRNALIIDKDKSETYRRSQRILIY